MITQTLYDIMSFLLGLSLLATLLYCVISYLRFKSQTNLGQSLIKGANEAIKFETGNLNLKTTTVEIKESPVWVKNKKRLAFGRGDK